MSGIRNDFGLLLERVDAKIANLSTIMDAKFANLSTIFEKDLESKNADLLPFLIIMVGTMLRKAWSFAVEVSTGLGGLETHHKFVFFALGGISCIITRGFVTPGAGVAASGLPPRRPLQQLPALYQPGACALPASALLE